MRFDMTRLHQNNIIENKTSYEKLKKKLGIFNKLLFINAFIYLISKP